MFCRVAVNYPVRDGGLTYRLPLGVVPVVGQLVDVPLRKRAELGLVLEVSEAAPPDSGEIVFKEILGLRDDYPVLSEQELRLYKWMSDYYHYSLGQLVVDCLPASKKRPRALEMAQATGVEPAPTPTAAQAMVIETVRGTLGHFSRHLIHGVTGSGKTLVFLEVIRSVLATGKSALYLLPEINLTPQFVETFSRHLGFPVYSFHSEITASQKYLIWKEASQNRAPRLFIGVRSAVFLPVVDLGVVVVDEEHDGSFKQDDRCAYNARDVGIKKAQLADCPVILASATPSLETWQNFQAPGAGTYYHPLRERVTNASLPLVSFIDTKLPKTARREAHDPWPLHPDTVSKISEGLAKGEQVLVFINRLGFANYVQCRACGHQFHCKNCSVTMRYFKQKHLLSCQHCEYHEPMPSGCPKCGNLTLLQKGFGTERVQQEVSALFPQARVERFDRDEIKTFAALQDKLQRFHAGEIDVLVGTQMLSKGHNFERVKKVIILGVDSQLNMPDFRANERIWQTIVQVAGRAGRYSHDGEVLVQTATPDAPLFELIRENSFDGFYRSEARMRELCECPPFYRIAAIYFSHRDQATLTKKMDDEVSPALHGLRSKHFSNVLVLGPRPALIEKRANQYSWTVLLKSKSVNELHNFIDSFLLNWPVKSGVSLKVDVDPQHIS